MTNRRFATHEFTTNMQNIQITRTRTYEPVDEGAVAMTDEDSIPVSGKREGTKLSGHSMSMIRICPKCESDMEVGFLGSKSPYTLSWYGKDKETPVTTHRCSNCGFIEQWATKPKTDFLGAVFDQGKLKCPHCGAIYVYPDTAVYVRRDKPLIDCMNCRKPILIMNYTRDS